MRLPSLLIVGLCFSAPIAVIMLHGAMGFGWKPDLGLLGLDELGLAILAFSAGITLAWYAQRTE